MRPVIRWSGLASVVDFEVFRGPLVAALRRSVRGNGGRPPFDPALMFKILVLQAGHRACACARSFMIVEKVERQPCGTCRPCATRRL